MKERPILFSAPMIRALLDGRKTQTRRLVTPQPPSEAATKSTPFSIGPAVSGDVKVYSLNDHDRLPKEPGVFSAYGSVGMVRTLCGQTTWRSPYGVPGDRLWVQETHRILATPNMPEGDVYVEYAADDNVTRRTLTAAELRKFSVRKRPYATHPGRFMYRTLSRLTLDVTDVRLERLHTIITSETDALAEGLVQVEDHIGPRFGLTPDALTNRTAWAAFARLWKGINGPESWDANPYVWAVTFKVVPA